MKAADILNFDNIHKWTTIILTILVSVYGIYTVYGVSDEMPFAVKMVILPFVIYGLMHFAVTFCMGIVEWVIYIIKRAFSISTK